MKYKLCNEVKFELTSEALLMQCRLKPPGHRALSNKKRSSKLVDMLRSYTRTNRKKIHTDRIYNFLRFEIG